MRAKALQKSRVRMLKYVSYDIVFQEIPDQTTLAINISNCPNRCAGCHSRHLTEDIGEPLTKEVLAELIGCYASAITCVCFMGGDREPQQIEQLALYVRELSEQDSSHERLKTAWYSGRAEYRWRFANSDTSVGEQVDIVSVGVEHDANTGVSVADAPVSNALMPDTPPFDYIKLGAYVESLGSLRAPTTNQRLYKIDESGCATDITNMFWH